MNAAVNVVDSGMDVFRLTKAELGSMYDAVNASLADERDLKSRVAIFREGVNYTPELKIEAETGWFNPMIADILSSEISVVVNDIGLTRPVANIIDKYTDYPGDWLAQQNMYITPGARKGFAPHCDPHHVVVAQVFGHKEWAIYDKVQDNPLMTNESDMVADPDEQMPERIRFTVQAGDCFVLPRGVFHDACAFDGPSVHIAIGIIGAHPVDYLWALADAGLHQSDMRADMEPKAALKKAMEFMSQSNLAPKPMPRNPIAKSPKPNKITAGLSFEEALHAVSRS
ncbi:MAG: JmjC domain-containing protein [Alphaproteobacteria bacterium]|jgi:hypothetical protein